MPSPRDLRHIERAHENYLRGRHYPNELTIEQAERMPHFETFNSWRAAKARAAKIGGVPYTQIDSDTGAVIYAKGFNFVNRTGVYAVAKRSSKRMGVLD